MTKKDITETIRMAERSIRAISNQKTKSQEDINNLQYYTKLHKEYSILLKEAK